MSAKQAKTFAYMVAYAWDLELPSATTKAAMLQFMQQNIGHIVQTPPSFKIPQRPLLAIKELYDAVLDKFHVPRAGKRGERPVELQQSQINEEYLIAMLDTGFAYDRISILGLYDTSQNDAAMRRLEPDRDVWVSQEGASLVAVVYPQADGCFYVNGAQVQLNPKHSGAYLLPSEVQNEKRFYFDFTPIRKVDKNDRVLVGIFQAVPMSVDVLFEKIASKPAKTSAFFADCLFKAVASDPRRLEVERAAGVQNELELESETFSVTSQLSLTRITHPVRGAACTHFNTCMDLKEYIAHRTNGSASCYLCKQKCEFSDLRVDAVGQLIVEKKLPDLIVISASGVSWEDAAANGGDEESGWDL